MEKRREGKIILLLVLKIVRVPDIRKIHNKNLSIFTIFTHLQKHTFPAVGFKSDSYDSFRCDSFFSSFDKDTVF